MWHRSVEEQPSSFDNGVMTEPEEGKDDAVTPASAPSVPKISVDASELVQRSTRMSDASAALVAESMELLGMKSSVPATLRPISPNAGLGILRSRSASPDSGDFSVSSVPVYPRNPPTFKRIDFDDRLTELSEDRKPAWKNLQESVTDSYHKAKRTAERTKDEQEFLENTFSRPRRRRDDSSPFRHLHSDTGFVPSIRSASSVTMPSISDRSRLMSSGSMSNVFASGSGPYAAPAVSLSQGIESRYEDIARDVEARLLKSLPLSAATRSYTMKEFRRAPEPASGSASEKDDYDFSMYTPRPYYSRPNRDDPDYFDFDLQHSVNLFKRPEGKYVPRRPQEWESKLVGEITGKGSAPLSGYMFTKGDTDWRSNNSSFLSAALRTPKFWEQRFESLGKEVRDSNPISLESINRRIKQIEWDRRNRPITSRFTEYRDPDHEDYNDPREDD